MGVEITYFGNLASNQEIQIKKTTEVNVVLIEMGSKETLVYVDGA